jgi:hypothetical protein
MEQSIFHLFSGFHIQFRYFLPNNKQSTEQQLADAAT